MKPRLLEIGAKKLIGTKVTMSFVNDKTRELWQTFMPKRNAIKNRVDDDLICMQVYSTPPVLENFDPTAVFQKWAAAEVTDLSDVPNGMKTFEIPGGLYAVFDYKGRALDFAPTFRYIFTEWLPQSAYEVDERPHFEILGAKYKNNEPDSEEEIWIPVRLK
ncbi:MAG: GyrI-like domain-containing protein [Mucilaginibacter sp.]|nr:GyrI-like domain-containing protein [Mucilaginibacter sp.]